MKTKLLSTVVATALLGLSGTASAYMTFFDEDLNNSATVPLALTPYSSAKEAQFKAQLTGVSTETFESQATGAIAPLTLNFGGSLTATLTGGGKVASVSPGTTNGFGRYSIPPQVLRSTGRSTPEALKSISVRRSQPSVSTG